MDNKESIKKALFLDIDGVLSRAEYGKDLYEDTYGDYCLALHRPSVEALKKLLDKHQDLSIVWMTDWAKPDGNGCICKNECVASPLQTLSSFSWIQSRVLGSIFNGQWKNANGGGKILAIDEFIRKNIVEHYAIVDDDTYDMHGEIEEMSSHFVHVNSLKSFLEDDIPIVEKALSIPMSAYMMCNVLRDMDHNDSFCINSRWKCRFDYAQHIAGEQTLFSKFMPDLNCPRTVSECRVNVYDMQKDEYLAGKLVLAVDKDLSNRHDVMLCTKPLDHGKWESTTTVVELADIKKCVEH